MELEFPDNKVLIPVLIEHSEFQSAIKDYVRDCCAICFVRLDNDCHICDDCLATELDTRRKT